MLDVLTAKLVSKWRLKRLNGVTIYTVPYRALNVRTQHHFVLVINGPRLKENLTISNLLALLLLLYHGFSGSICFYGYLLIPTRMVRQRHSVPMLREKGKKEYAFLNVIIISWLCNVYNINSERFEPTSHFISRWSMIVETWATVNHTPITGLCPTNLLSQKSTKTGPNRNIRNVVDINCVADHEMNLELLPFNTLNKAKTFP